MIWLIIAIPPVMLGLFSIVAACSASRYDRLAREASEKAATDPAATSIRAS